MKIGNQIEKINKKRIFWFYSDKKSTISNKYVQYVIIKILKWKRP